MDTSTLFAFSHKVFSVEGGYFAGHENGSAPYFAIPMGDSIAQLSLPAIREEFFHHRQFIPIFKKNHR